jgi:hypothetical protein
MLGVIAGPGSISHRRLRWVADTLADHSEPMQRQRHVSDFRLLPQEE